MSSFFINTLVLSTLSQQYKSAHCITEGPRQSIVIMWTPLTTNASAKGCGFGYAGFSCGRTSFFWMVMVLNYSYVVFVR